MVLFPAIGLDVWDCINPEKTKDELRVPSKPEWPTLSTVKVQKEVVEQLVNHSSDSHEIYMSMLVRRLRIEIDPLDPTDIALGSFNLETPVHELDIPHIYSRIRKMAPGLCKLLFALLEP